MEIKTFYMDLVISINIPIETRQLSLSNPPHTRLAEDGDQTILAKDFDDLDKNIPTKTRQLSLPNPPHTRLAEDVHQTIIGKDFDDLDKKHPCKKHASYPPTKPTAHSPC